MLGNLDRVYPNPLNVLVGSVGLGFNSQRQSLNGAQVQRGHVLDVVLFMLKAIEIQAIRTINPVNGWESEQRSLPTGMLIDQVRQASERSAKQVIRETPEITLLPYLLNRLMFGKRDHHRNRNGVGQKVHGSGGNQGQGKTLGGRMREPTGVYVFIDEIRGPDRSGISTQIECEVNRCNFA